jgi:chromosome segregation ATPase
MEWINQHMGEFLSKSVPTAQSGSVIDFPKGVSSPVRDDAATALDLVSEWAAAIRKAEERASAIMARAENLASSALEKLRLAEARIELAETAQRKAEAEVAKLTAAAAHGRNELEQAQARLAANEAELAADRDRANAAERRAADAEADIERIVQAIRKQISATPMAVAPEKAGAVA